MSYCNEGPVGAIALSLASVSYFIVFELIWGFLHPVDWMQFYALG